MNKVSAEKIDSVLPQTQCTLCGYSGCMPYAQAIIQQDETIDKCLPGGTKVLEQLARLTHQSAQPYLESMKQKQKLPMVALIQEESCIGCVKCIKACPVDAIIGTGKMMHTVLMDECTGCGLCVDPCPMDCIEMIEVKGPATEAQWQQQADKARYNYYRHQRRVDKVEQQDAKPATNISTLLVSEKDEKADKKSYILQALARSQAKKEIK